MRISGSRISTWNVSGRPAGREGAIGGNTDSLDIEWYDGSNWITPSSNYLKLDGSNTGDITVNRDGDGVITSIEYDSRTVTFTYSSGYISSYTDGTYTWTVSRNASNQVTGIVIT